MILDKLNTREELNSVNMNEEKLTFLTLYLICQPKLKSKNVDRAFTLLERFAQKPENKHLYIFIGDFLDSEFYGFSDADSFERRLICYSKSGHDGRIIACYMMLLQNLQDEHSRSRLENKILDMFGAKENFTLNDVYLMREISMKGGNFSLTDFLEIDFNKIFKEDYQFRASNDYTEIYSDLMLMVKVTENSKFFKFFIIFQFTLNFRDSLLKTRLAKRSKTSKRRKPGSPVYSQKSGSTS